MKFKLEITSGAYIVLINILIVLAIVGSFLIYRLDYVTGTQNRVDNNIVYSFGLFIILYPLMAIIALCTSIFALISLLKRHSNVGQVLLKLALIPLGPVIVCCAFFLSGPGAAVFLKGFEQWVVQNADIDTIQTWLASEGLKHSGQFYSSEDGFPEELPECLVKLNPKFISFSDSNSTNGMRVEMTWFYVMDEYGLIIGSPLMGTPKKGHIVLEYGDYEFRRPVKKGAYVFIRG